MRYKKASLGISGFVIVTLMAVGCGKEYSKGTPYGQSIGNIHFDQTLPKAQYAQMARDLQILDSIPIDPAQDAEMKRIMKLKDTSPRSLRNWLEDRVQYIVSEDFDLDQRVFGKPKAAASIVSEAQDPKRDVFERVTK